MGRPRRPAAKRADLDSDEAGPLKSVIFFSSSDDEEANKDLSLELVERARERELKRKGAAESELIALSSDSSEDIEMNFDRTTFEDKEEEKGKKKKSKGRNKKKKDGEATAAEEKAVDDAPNEEEPVGTADSVITEVNEVPDNAVLRKLLRGPRYFDPGERNLGACFNCGEEGHAAVNCTMEKRKKPCFVCGMFGHIAKRCTQEIHCYVCKNYGHLCCVDFVDVCPREVSCYNCAQSGHTGLGCAKTRGEMTDVASRTLCYKCGDVGHFARGCTKNTKFDRWEAGSSTRRLADENRDSLAFRSAPNDFDMARKKKKKKFQYEDKFEDRWNTTSGKSRKKVAGSLMIQVTCPEDSGIQIQLTYLEDSGKRFGDIQAQPLLERATKFTQPFLAGITQRPNLLSRSTSPLQELHILMLQLAAITMATLPRDIMVIPRLL